MLADANDDSRRLYAAVERRGGQLVTPLKGEAKAESTLRRMPATRLGAVKLWRDRPEIAIDHARLIARMLRGASG